MSQQPQNQPPPQQRPIKHWKELPEKPRPPERPKDGVGTKGREISLKTNYYEVKVKDWDLPIIHYDVQIKHPGQKEGSVPISKNRKMEIFEKFRSSNDNLFRKYKIAYDGEKSAVSVGIIPQFKSSQTYKVAVKNYSGRDNNFDVVIKFARQHNLKEVENYLRGQTEDAPSSVLQFVEIMFRHKLATTYTPIGQNSFFCKNGDDRFWQPEAISGDMEASRGFFAALKPAAWKDGSMLLNIDVVHAAFYIEQPVIEFMKTNLIFNKDDISQGNLNKTLSEGKRKALLKKLIGLKVRATHTPMRRTYKIIDILNKGADRQLFKGDGGQNQSVQDYFETTYNKRLKYPKMNVIRAAPENRTVYLPIEFCEISKGQKVKRQNIGAKETASFIKFTAKPPSTRLQNINHISRIKELTDNELVKDLGFSFLDKPVQLTGRVLPPPNLHMNPSDVIVPFKGQWDTRNKKFFESKNIDRWIILSYSYNTIEDIRNFINEIRRLGRTRGMQIAEPLEVKIKERDHKPDVDFPMILKKYSHKGDIQMIMVILNSRKADSPYAMVKKVGDIQLKVSTQVVLQDNVRKASHSTIYNLLFKMNAKMGGINYVIDSEERRFVIDRPVLIMGADVNHPPASDKSGIPSVAAVVGSLDRHATKYAVEVRPQTSRQEIIEKLKEMTMSLLKTFYKRTGRRPERIIMYRDGVSESQFLEVLAYELKQIRAACTALEKDYEPAITFIVVQKRHHTRFFPVNESDGVGRNKNVPPGTIVDTGVTHIRDIDFYLCSHEGIQGTSKPTHYFVLWDDTDFTIDQLQCFSFAMCHVYARCSRSVSIPTPAYYAHWAAHRGKLHLQDLCIIGNERPSDDVLLNAVRMDMDDKMRTSMYFL